MHGAHHGGWCGEFVAERLRDGDHSVPTPTSPGLGESVHLLSSEITLDTFIDDIDEHIESERLTDVVLVVHSFGLPRGQDDPGWT